MIRHSAVLTAALMTAWTGSSASAADLEPQAAPELYAPEIVTPTVAQGWYIRGDFGYAGWTGDEKPDYRVTQADGTVLATDTFDSARFSKPVSFGGGIGYQLNDFLRTDVTADIFDGRLNGVSEISSPCAVTELAGTGCGRDYRASYRGIGVLANGYIDLGTVAGFTPYIGGGLGATQINWGSTRTDDFCTAGSAACSGNAYGSQNFDGETSWRFTYALMAGVSYDITNRIKLDLGYRYSDIAGGDMFKTGSGSTVQTVRTKGSDDGLSRHEIRAGLRLTTW